MMRAQRDVRLLILAMAGLPASALGAPIPLDSSNWKGPAGARYWTINSPGDYVLAVPESTFATQAEVAIWIQTGNVTVDGAGKTITGSGPPGSAAPGAPNVYGVRANAGFDVPGVRVTNLRVQNKFFGVIFEAVYNSRVDGVIATGNQYGIYFWRTQASTFQGNVASSNLQSGIQCDGDQVDSASNVIADNVADANALTGIWLWDRCPNSNVLSNVSRDNGQMGISVAANATGSSITFNVLQGNSSGIFASSQRSTIANNLAEDNTNVGILMSAASANTVEGNTTRRNQNAGIWLDGSTNNVLRRNTSVDNRFWGIFNGNASAGQTIYDNYFSNAAGNAGFGGGTAAWSVALAAATNVVGGPYTGGNFWALPSRTGFSETAADNDHNGISDAAYPLAGGNVDTLPLAGKARAFPNASFDADYRGDLLWRKASTGENALWLMNGAAAASQLIAPVTDTGWSIVGRESFDGDGNTDILWRHADGRNAVWFMEGGSVKPSSTMLPPVQDANWRVAGVGDVDGDGFADVVWRHATTGQPVIWYVRGATVKWSATLNAVSTGWQVVGVADFDGDAKADILWRNAATGQNAIWYFESYRSLTSALLASATPAWSVVGVGDFNGDGRADILWRNGSGQNALWFQNGATTTSSSLIPPAATDWSVGWVGDVDGDGKSDIVWRRTDGSTALWIMNGAAVSSSALLAPAPGWTLISR